MPGLVVAHALSIPAAEQASLPSFPARHVVKYTCTHVPLVLYSSVHASCTPCVLHGTRLIAHDMDIAQWKGCHGFARLMFYTASNCVCILCWLLAASRHGSLSPLQARFATKYSNTYGQLLTGVKVPFDVEGHLLSHVGGISRLSHKLGMHKINGCHYGEH